MPDVNKSFNEFNFFFFLVLAFTWSSSSLLFMWIYSNQTLTSCDIKCHAHHKGLCNNSKLNIYELELQLFFK